MPLLPKWATALAATISCAAVAATVLIVFQPRQVEAPAVAVSAKLDAAESHKVAPVEAEPAPQVPPAERGVEESSHPLTNARPADLIEGTLQARERSDKAWLARTLASLAGTAMITDVDLHSANRQFLTRSVLGMWQAVDRAWRGREYSVTEKGETAEVVFQAGGSLGELTIVLVRIGECWFYAGT